MKITSDKIVIELSNTDEIKTFNDLIGYALERECLFEYERKLAEALYNATRCNLDTGD